MYLVILHHPSQTEGALPPWIANFHGGQQTNRKLTVAVDSFGSRGITSVRADSTTAVFLLLVCCPPQQFTVAVCLLLDRMIQNYKINGSLSVCQSIKTVRSKVIF